MKSGTDFAVNGKGILRIFTEKPICAYKDKTDSEIEAEAGRTRDRSLSDKAMLEYLYGSPANEVQYYQGIKSYGNEFLLNTDEFKESKIDINTLSALPADEERRRNILLTLKFLSFILEQCNTEIRIQGTERDADPELFLADLNFEMDMEMEPCGLQAFGGGNPYDAFLSMLLFCDDPFSLFQAIWSQEHPLTDYIMTEWSGEETDWNRGMELELVLLDEENRSLSSWTAGEENFIYSLPKLPRGKEYALSVLCRKKSWENKKDGYETVWQQVIHYRPDESGEVTVRVKREGAEICTERKESR